MHSFGAWGTPFSTAASIVALTEIAANPLKMLSQCLPVRSFEIYSIKSVVHGPKNSLLKLWVASIKSPVEYIL